MRAYSVTPTLSISPLLSSSSPPAPSIIRSRPRTTSVVSLDPPPRLSNGELKSTLRRLSKMVLAGYGGASLLFFGISPTKYHTPFGPSSPAKEMASEERQLAHAVDASEAEAAGDFSDNPPSAGADGAGDATEHQYSWWDVLLGKHDQEIFERAAGLGSSSKKAEEEIKAKMTATAVCHFL
jgi:sn1-specific diacylglycerol lipase